MGAGIYAVEEKIVTMKFTKADAAQLVETLRLTRAPLVELIDPKATAQASFLNQIIVGLEAAVKVADEGAAKPAVEAAPVATT